MVSPRSPTAPKSCCLSVFLFFLISLFSFNVSPITCLTSCSYPPSLLSSLLSSPPPLDSSRLESLSSASASTVLLTGLQLPTDLLLSLDIYIAMEPTQYKPNPFYIQLYSPSLVLVSSQLVSPSNPGLLSVPLSWPIDGHMLAFASTSASAIPIPVYSHNQINGEDEHLFWTNEFSQLVTTTASSLLSSGVRAPRKRQYAFTANFLQGCDATGTAFSVCAPVTLSQNSSQDSTLSATYLLIGQRFAHQDFISSVSFLIVSLLPVEFQLWSSSDSWSLVARRLYTPTYVGHHRIALNWPVAPNYVAGISSAFGQKVPISFYNHSTLAEGAIVHKFRQSAPNQDTLSFTDATPIKQYINVQFHTPLSCDVNKTGDALLPRSTADDSGLTVLLSGRPVVSNAFLYSIDFFVETLTPVYFYVFSTLTGAGVTTHQLKFKTYFLPSDFGLNRVYVAWPVLKGEYLAYSGSAMDSAPIWFTPNTTQTPSTQVTLFNELVTTVGQTLLSQPSTSFRNVNVQFATRPYGVCTGSNKVPSLGSIGNCAYVKSSVGSFCNYACNPGTRLSGTINTCSPTSTGALTGSQTCKPLPCSFVLAPGQGATYGTCSNDTVLISGTTCNVMCKAGLVSDYSTTVTCQSQVLTTNFTHCYTPANCAFPSVLPTGTSYGNCTRGGTLAHMSMCQIIVNRGYVAYNGSTQITCYNGKLSVIPKVLPSPCYFADLPPSVDWHTCPHVLSSGSSCNLKCTYGFSQSGTSLGALSTYPFSCYRGQVTGQVPKCRLIPDCPMPTMPEGIDTNTCQDIFTLSKFDQACQLKLRPGYKLLSDNSTLQLSCHLGDLSPIPSVIPQPCTLPRLLPNGMRGTCNDSFEGLPSGQVCQVNCSENYITFDSPSIQCDFGEISGSIPQCHMLSCAIPAQLPAGLSAGSCMVGGSLRADGDGFPPNCTLSLQSGWQMLSGDLTLRCAPDGTFSGLPEIVQSILPDYGYGACTGTWNWAYTNQMNNLRFVSHVECRDGQVMSGFRFLPCQLPDQSTGLQLVIQCIWNSIIDLGAASFQIGSNACVAPVSNSQFPNIMSFLGRLFCPDRTALVGVGVGQCYVNGALYGVQWTGTCRPIIAPEQEQQLVGNYAGNHVAIDVGSPSAALNINNFLAVTSIPENSCPISSFNYMVGLESPGLPRPFYQLYCVKYFQQSAGLSSAPIQFYGADVQERTQLDPPYQTKCNVLIGSNILTSGRVFSFQFFAKQLGQIWFQTYKNVSNEYIITGSFQYEVQQYGAQQIGVPSSQQWDITPDHFFGFCYRKVPIIPGSPYILRFPFADVGNSLTNLIVLGFDGFPGKVGEKAGGGGDSLRSPTQLIYSVAIGVVPADKVEFGYAIYERKNSDETTNSPACSLLTQPPIQISGRVTHFNYHVINNDGEVTFQTYRPDGTGGYVLQGSYTVESLKKGTNTVQVPADQRWDVLPGDVLAHCWVTTSVSFNLIYNALGISDQKNFATYNTDQTNTPAWVHYIGAIQTEIGSQVSGIRIVMSNIFYHFRSPSGVTINLERMYSVQIGLQATPACAALDETPVGGFGKVVCLSGVCTLTCDLGYGTSQPTQTCNADGSWSPQGQCVPVDNPTLTQSFALPDLNPYKVFLHWTPPAQLPLGVLLLGWEVSWNLQYPLPDSGDLQLEALKGVKAIISGNLSLHAEYTSYQLPADISEKIEHIGFLAKIRMVVTGGSSRYVETRVSLPCACNMYKASKESDPIKSILFGWPLDVSITQILATNNLMFTFTPNSLCTDSYQVELSAVDGTALGVDPVVIKSFHAEDSKSCSFFHPTTKKIGSVAYPLHGRELQICLVQRPMYICTTCASEYNSGLFDNGTLPTPKCISYTPSFLVRVMGKVVTQKTKASPVENGVQGVTVTAIITDPITQQPILVNRNGILQPISASIQTDITGRYLLSLNSTALKNKNYGILITPSKVDVDPVTGKTLVHEFFSAFDTRNNTFFDVVEHSHIVGEATFYDKSVVPVTGRVTLSTLSSSSFYRSTALKGCGVFNITVNAYSVVDVEFLNPLASSLPTSITGEYVLSVPMFSSFVLVPSQAGVNRTFSPASLQIQVQQELLHVEPFFDQTLASFQMKFDGGNCGLHVGSIRPTAFYDSCGPSAHILLPAFADQHGYTYTLPAVSFTIKLFDSKNIFSGLQAKDIDGTKLPNYYLNGDVFTFVASVKPFYADLSYPDPIVIPLFQFTYFAPPDISFLNPLPCSDPKAQSEVTDYTFFKTGSVSAVVWTLTETYGYITDTNSDQTSICNNVTAGIEILDDITPYAQPLLPLYLNSFNCTDGQHPCAVTGVYDEQADRTLLAYMFQVGDIQASNFQTDSLNTAHTQPAYSRRLQYRLAGSVHPYNSYYVVVTGTSAIGGSLSIIYPPWDPLYILRDPPGSLSTATLKAGSSISGKFGIASASSVGGGFSVSAKAGKDHSKYLCTGANIGPDVGAVLQLDIQMCTNTFSIEGGGHLDFDYDGSRAKEEENSYTFLTTFESEVTTTDDRLTKDGMGDLFLTISGSFALSQSQTVSVSIDDNGECTSSLVPSVGWKMNPGATYQWVSAELVQLRLMHDLNLTMDLILKEFQVESLEQLKLINTDAAREKVKIYQSSEAAWEGWKAMLAYNEELKEKATEWTDFYESLSAPGGSNSAHDPRGGVDSLPGDPTASSFIDSVLESGTAKFLNPEKTNKATNLASSTLGDNPEIVSGIDANRYMSNNNYQVSNKSTPSAISSITFYGDSTLSFEIASSFEITSTRTVVTAIDTESVLAGIEWEHEGFGAGAEARLAIGIDHTTTNEGTTSTSNTIRVDLVDSDRGDMFQVKIYRDPVFGSPVYKTVAGVSRCPHEKGTVAREKLEFLLSQHVFTHMNPNDPVINVGVTLINNSPTQETFIYGLEYATDTNPNNLNTFIAGVQNMQQWNQIRWRVPWGTPIRSTLNLWAGRDPVDKTDYTNIKFKVSSQVDDPFDACEIKYAVLSVSFDSQCNAIAFGGAIAVSNTFSINSDTLLASPTHTATLSITIKNPDYVGASESSWLYNINSGNLEAITIEYRKANQGDTLSETDWQPIKLEGSSNNPATIIDLIAQDAISDHPRIINEIMTVSWDVSALSDGVYQLRATTSCKMPVGALDESIYTSSTDIITGRIDMSLPQLFGDPLPGLSTFYPGKEISATFNKVISCDSYYGHAQADMWVNPTNLAEPQGNNVVVPTLLYCSGRTVFIQPYAPVYDSLSGRLLTVKLSGVTDRAGNKVSGNDVQWSFKVGFFDSLLSAALIQGVELNFPFTTLKLQSLFGSTYPSTLSFIQALTLEVQRFINSAIDLLLQPAVPVSTSNAALRLGSVLINNIQTSNDSFKTIFNITIQPLPIFPGDPPATYSPSFFASYFVKGLNNQTILGVNNISYPLLSRLAYLPSNPKQVSVLVYPVSVGPSNSNSTTKTATFHQPKRIMQVHAVNSIPPYTLVSLNIGLNPGSSFSLASATVLISWLVAIPSSPALSMSDINIRYRIVANDLSDPDFVAADHLAWTTLYSNTDMDTSSQSFSISNNIQQDKAMYSLTMLEFPTVVGGFTAVIEIQVHFNDTLLYTVSETSFIVGPPSSPLITAIEQKPTIDFITVTFYPTLQSGLQQAIGDEQMVYSIHIREAGNNQSSAFTIANRFLTYQTSASMMGLPVITCQFNLTAVFNNLSLSLPVAGASASLIVGVSGSSPLSTSEINEKSIIFHSTPPPILIYRTSQIGINQFIVRFFGNITDNIIHYRLGYIVECVGHDPIHRIIIIPLTELESIIHPPALPVLSYTLTLPYPSTAWVDIQIALSATTSFASTAFIYQSIYQPVFVNMPSSPVLQVVSPPSDVNHTFSALLSWQSSSILSPSNKPFLRYGFAITSSFSDGLSFISMETPYVELDYSSSSADYSFSYLCTLPYFPSPTAKNTKYSLHVRTIVYNSDNHAVLFRSDGMGLHKLYSNASTVSVTFDLPSDVAIEPSALADINYPLEGSSTSPQAPAAPEFLHVHPLNPSQVRVLFPVVPSATFYLVSWFNATSSSTVPLGVKMVEPYMEIDGIMVLLLTDVIHVPPSLSSSTFKFACVSQNSFGQSPKVIKFVNIQSAISPDASFTVTASIDKYIVSPLPSTTSNHGWNLTIPLVSQFDIALTPAGDNIRAVRAVFLHAVVTDIASLFQSTSSSQNVVSLSACSGFSLSIVPFASTLNFVYVELTAEDFSIHYNFVQIFIDAKLQ